jgi:hypothetical protein
MSARTHSIAGAALVCVVVGLLAPPPDAGKRGLAGFAGATLDSTKPRMTAFFRRESYRPGEIAELVIVEHASNVRFQIFRAGGEQRRTLANDVLVGVAVTRPVAIGEVRPKRVVHVLVRRWQSGVYYVELRSNERVGYATFILRPIRLGVHPVAIVLPTQTWQAYNFRDDDGDGRQDTWYAGGPTARMARPFLNRGVPPHFTYYDAPFLRWAFRTHRDADYLADQDLNSASTEQLRRAYELIVFEGHHEYVTEHEYATIEGYRDRGGNLLFLSANNFFYRITKRAGVMTRTGTWRALGRPEAALIGVQFFHNDEGEHRGEWVLGAGARALPWLLDGTTLRIGSRLTSGGIEADASAASSPRGLRIVGRIASLFGDGRDAEMSYYETPAGAKVFAAGAFTLAGSIGQQPVASLVANLWRHLSTD